MIDWLAAEATGHYFFYAYPVCLLILFPIFGVRRIRILIPSIIITLVIVNPWFYNAWTGLGLGAYWRILWVVPVVPIVSAVIPALIEYIGRLTNKQGIRRWIKVSIAVIGVTVITFLGSFVYSTARGQFTAPSANAEKVPEHVVQIADRLLELKKRPRVILQDPLGVYIRQYTGEIDTMFGRDVSGYIRYPNNTAIKVNNLLNDPNADLLTVSQIMLDDGYDYLVTYSGRDVGDSLEQIDQIGQYAIYKAVGNPSVIKQRDELGQIVSITTIDEDGEPVNNSFGYSTENFSYTSDGRLAREWYTKSDGEIYVQAGGYIAIEHTWDGDQIISRSYTDANKMPTQRLDGYSKVFWYRDNKSQITNVSFYDLDGKEIDLAGLNLVKDVKTDPEGWSKWMTPAYDTDCSLFTLCTVDYCKKNVGDMFTCQIEIEFSDVSATEEKQFRFWTQGPTDGSWNSGIGNVWWRGVYLEEVPSDGVYKYSFTRTIDEDTVKGHTFEVGFRCDYWGSGSFRVRHLKIEKGELATTWTPGI